ncbi:hypothetical protein F5B22DRAFT_505935 [Xylaria bambusicola]|uniref:uncharacterized protein n=1 Tax=Xylaria bambusicola TaxID=326684 RepID=UPI002007C3C2|nr:uncharacterized protein F5B22DRAFT_505935 [Xylaria bambusicola]KAI0521839.1 hypothetical protein F5B22DRAFT_505935 [Xylaria bambusicola]
MESFAKLKRRGTDLLNSLPHQMPSMPHIGGGHGMKGTWQHIPLPALPRSSHSLDVVAGNAYIFGGEVESRKPVDNDMHVVVLPWSGAPADYYAIKAKPSPRTDDSAIPAVITEEDETDSQLRDPLTEVPLGSSTSTPEVELEPDSSSKGKGPDTGDVPAPRIGHATAVIGSRIFLFGGRAAAAGSSTLDENGRVWIFETKTHTWTYLDPHHSSPIPPPRSYHAAVATEKPRDFAIKPMRLRRSSTWKEWAEGDSAEVGIPQRPITGTIAEKATDDEAFGAGFGTFFIHAGCLADGTRTSDVWAFDVHARTWKQLPNAPGPARGGTALALAKSRLYRFGGFDGTRELGGQLDVLHLGLDEFDDQNSRGEIGVFARGEWESIVAPSSLPEGSTLGSTASSETAGLTASSVGTTSEPWPSPRSVANLSLVQAGGGREYLVLALGESSPSTDGHETPGTFHSDIWAFQIPALAGTAASYTDAFLSSVGRKTGEGRWYPVSIGPFDADEERDVQGPGARGWFGAAPLGDLEENAIFVAGGLGESGARMGDGWIFRLE